jgi:hypothetical protein
MRRSVAARAVRHGVALVQKKPDKAPFVAAG